MVSSSGRSSVAIDVVGTGIPVETEVVPWVVWRSKHSGLYMLPMGPMVAIAQYMETHPWGTIPWNGVGLCVMKSQSQVFVKVLVIVVTIHEN